LIKHSFDIGEDDDEMERSHEANSQVSLSLESASEELPAHRELSLATKDKTRKAMDAACHYSR
jgi:hypothetical protein